MTTAPEPQTGPLYIARRLWKYGRTYRFYFLGGIAATVCLNFANLIRPQLLKTLTDKVLTGTSLEGKIPLLAWILAGLLGATVVKGLFTWLQGLSMNAASMGTVRDLREAAYAHLVRLPVRWFDQSRIGDLVIRFTDDLAITTQFMTGGIITLSNDVVILITSLIWMLAKDWKLTLVAMVVSPLAGMTVRRFSKRVSEATVAAQKELSNLTSMVQETVSGIRVVKSFGSEAHEGDRFSRQNDDTFRWAMRIVQFTATQSPIVELLATGAIALVLYYCALNVISGTLTLGDLLAFWAYMLLATTPINRLPHTLTLIQRGCTSAGRLLAVLDTAEEDALASAAYNAPAKRLERVEGAIEFRDVRFRYSPDREEALRGVNLRIEPGQHVAIVGRNGAGKSTLMNLLMRFYEPTAGEILIDGHPIRDIAVDSLRRHIGLVTQETVLFSRSLRENVAYGRPDAPLEEVEAAAEAAGAHGFIQAMGGYEIVLGERGQGLSGGEKQRVALARLLLVSPPVVVLDEATSALDPNAEKALQKALTEATRGRTVISIAHRLVASRHADRIVVLDQGQVVESGTHDELMAAQGLYRDLYDTIWGAVPIAETGADA